MLTIRREQYSKINLQTALGDPRLFVDHARTFHARLCSEMGEAALVAQIETILISAAERGITATRDFLTYLDLALTFGLDWSKPGLQWLDEGMLEQAGGTVSDRLRRLRLEAIYRLEAESAAT